jgi:hypothetical protein
MATFTSATFIPQLQPYQPDLNLYSNLIQNKQSQYDSNWKSLNKVYGQYFYADLTRDDNIEKKDYLVDQINFNVGRLAGLDLSLQQNVSQATQVFKPFYEDKGLMKDMAWTKNFNMQVLKAQGFQGSANEKDRAMFWDTGLKELQYRRDEFKDTTAEKALNFQNVLYTPYVNVQDKALELAKEYGNIQTVEMSPDGRWVIKKTNGQVLEEPLQHLFEANLGNDPQVQAIYSTQAYVNRKDYAYSRAGEFGGDKNAAEMQYLEKNFNTLKGRSEKRHKQLSESSTAYENKIKDLQKQINEGNKDPQLQQQLDAYLENKSINDEVLSQSKKQLDKMNSGQSSTATTSTGFKNPFEDIETLRYMVDNGVAGSLLSRDLNEAAHIYAYRNSKVDMDANPYAILSDKHNYNMQEISQRHINNMEENQQKAQYDMELLKIKVGAERKMMVDKENVKAGRGMFDESGEYIPFEDQENSVLKVDTDGTATDELNQYDLSTQMFKRKSDENFTPYISDVTTTLDQLIKGGQMTQAQAGQILSTPNAPVTSLDEFVKKHNGNLAGFASLAGADGLQKINTNFNTFLKNNSNLSVVKNNMTKLQESSLKFTDYISYVKDNTKWRKDFANVVEVELARLGVADKSVTKLLHDDNGNLVTPETFAANVKKAGLNPEDQRTFLSKLNNVSENVLIYGSGGAAAGAAGGSFFGGIGAIPGAIGLGLSGVAAGLGKGVYESFISGPNADENLRSLYDNLVTASNKAWSNSNLIKGAPIGYEKKDGGGTGLAVQGVRSIQVNPFSSKGRYYWGSAMSDINKLDFTDDGNARISIEGRSADKYENATSENSAKYKTIIGELQRQMSRPSQGTDIFELSSAVIAAGDANKGAIIIRPSAKFLEQFRSTNSDEDNKLLSKDEYNNILKNGISVIANSNMLNNALLQENYKDPLAIRVDNSPNKSYTYTDPFDSRYRFQIDKNQLGTGDYSITTFYPIWNPETGDFIETSMTDNTVTAGNNLSNIRSQSIFQGFPAIRQMNDQNMRYYGTR